MHQILNIETNKVFIDLKKEVSDDISFYFFNYTILETNRLRTIVSYITFGFFRVDGLFLN